MTTPPLAGRDGQIFSLVAQVVAIVKRRGIGDAADVLRVANEHLRPRPRRPEPVPFVVKAQAPRHSVELTALQYAVLEQVVNGATHGEAGRLLGLTLNAVQNHMRRVAHQMGVRTGTQAVALVLGGQVQVRRKQGGRAA